VAKADLAAQGLEKLSTFCAKPCIIGDKGMGFGTNSSGKLWAMGQKLWATGQKGMGFGTNAPQ